MAGLKDIAQAAGVSVGTVSRVLNQGRAHLYSPETRQRVMEASRAFGYRPNVTARAMRLSRTYAIGFAAITVREDGQLHHNAVYPFIVGMNQQLAQGGYHVALVERSELEVAGKPERPWAVQRVFFDGLVVHYGMTDRAERFSKDMGVPLLWWDSGVFEPTGCVYRDETEVGRQLTQTLIAMGHRRIGYIVSANRWRDYSSGQPLHFSHTQRYDSYREQMKRASLAEMVIIGARAEEMLPQLARLKPTAVITEGDDISAIEAAAVQLGWRVPRDLSIATLDRTTRLAISSMHVGGMIYDRLLLGQRAGSMMIAMLEQTPAVAVPSVRYVGDFDAGETILPPRPDSGS